MESVRTEVQADSAATGSVEVIANDVNTVTKIPSNVLNDVTMAYSVAQECRNCSLLVCQMCADKTLTQQRAEQEAREAERAAEEAESERNIEEEIGESNENEVPASPGQGGHSPPSLID
jgi:uncharacterized transporter YbjL